MATPRRRSARLSSANKQRTPGKKTQFGAVQLGSLLERDETPEVGQQQSIDDVVATPASAATIQEQLAKLSAMKTPQTEPRPERGEMHPKTIHQTTTKAPDSGLKLGFVDIPAQPRTSIASAQNTPSKSRASIPQNFEFKFGSDAQLSMEARKLMDNVREEAAKIKAQMQAEKDAQDQKDGEADQMFDGVSAAGRKIAKPRGKAGRFSGVHMAQFKKMDSIANHPSSFRAKPGFAQPTTQSLKRSGSRAGLDEPDRPRTAGKENPSRIPPPLLGRASTASPYKTLPASISDRSENTAPAKRPRRSELHDVSAGRRAEPVGASKPSTLPRPVSSSLLSPTKASMAKSTNTQVSSPEKFSALPRSSSVKSLHGSTNMVQSRPTSAHGNAPSRLPQVELARLDRPLPALPKTNQPEPDVVSSLPRSKSSSSQATTPKGDGIGSRLPTFAGLRSILRSTRRASGIANERSGTPKRPNTATAATESARKVDFTPSVKSRYAVKLAAGSPSPAKLHGHQSSAQSTATTAGLYDPAAYVIDDEDVNEEWEDAEDDVEYPTLPAPESDSAPVATPDLDDFSQKAKEHNRRESKEFKSIFTTLHHPSRPNPHAMNTNETSRTADANKVVKSPTNLNLSKVSPSTIRRVRTSGTTNLIEPFEDTSVQIVPHGLPNKKRRHDSDVKNDQYGQDDDAKENRRISTIPKVPGSWNDSMLEEEDEGEKRAGKRARMSRAAIVVEEPKSVKKPSAAREAAAKNAKERKGILSLSRLNMLSRPKQRG